MAYHRDKIFSVPKPAPQDVPENPPAEAREHPPVEQPEQPPINAPENPAVYEAEQDPPGEFYYDFSELFVDETIYPVEFDNTSENARWED
jgi:hypothetical protein